MLVVEGGIINRDQSPVINSIQNNNAQARQRQHNVQAKAKMLKNPVSSSTNAITSVIPIIDANVVQQKSKIKRLAANTEEPGQLKIADEDDDFDSSSSDSSSSSSSSSDSSSSSSSDSSSSSSDSDTSSDDDEIEIANDFVVDPLPSPTPDAPILVPAQKKG